MQHLLRKSCVSLGQLTLAVTTLALGPAITQSPGYVLLQPVGNDQTVLIDQSGKKLHSWPGSLNVSGHLAQDMTLLRTAWTGSISIGGATGRIQRLAQDGSVLWDYLIDGPFEYMHHDIEPMPNGNVLVIAWDAYTNSDAIARGRIPGTVGNAWYPDAVLELQQTGPTTAAVVWEWHLVDHLVQDFDPTKPGYGVIKEHPELLDINFPPTVLQAANWNHLNGLDYDPINDWIIISVRSQNEIYLIDHSTTTAEAAGHSGGQRGMGGDILWRWGNPQAYGAPDGFQVLFGQHDPRFIPPGFPGAGHVTLFNNGYLPQQSAVFELELPLDVQGNIVLDPMTNRYGPTDPTWVFTRTSLYSQFVSSAERLSNGNTLICSGQQGHVFEVDPAGQMVWSHRSQVFTLIFQAHSVDPFAWESSTQ